MSGVELKEIKRLDNIESGSKDSNYGSEETVGYGRPNPAYSSDDEPPDYRTASQPASQPKDDADGIVSNGENGLRRRQGDKIQQKHDDDDDDQYVESSDDDDTYDTRYARAVADIQKTISSGYEEHNGVIWTFIAVVAAILWFAYFGYAMWKTFDVNEEGSMRLLVVTVLVTLFIIANKVWCHLMKGRDMKKTFNQMFSPGVIQKISLITYWIAVVATALFIVTFTIVDVALNRPENLISAVGLIVFVLLFYVFSYNPAKVNWRPVFWGLALQFFFALFILRTQFGYEAFQWLGERVREFLAHTDKGSEFVFGQDYAHHFFALKVLTVIIFFSSAVSVLYYLGVMQFVIKYIARFLAFCLGTSPTESLNAAGNIFIGQSEAPLLISPFLKDMTRSELHAVCTGGFATIAGSVMAAYILIGVPANHLLSASVMSAPAALAMAKLFYPETKKRSASNAQNVYNIAKGTETNIIEACSKGATMSAPLIANIIVNLIAFIAILQFIDTTLIWLGHRVGFYNPELTFNLICSYIFYPLAYLLGVSNDHGDIMKVASRIGTKTFLNEFVAYAELSVYISNTEKYDAYLLNTTGTYNGTTVIGDDVMLNYDGTILKGGVMSPRSIVIATYALCGFSNLGSIGIQLGALGAMAPTRRKDLAKVVFRAMLAGNVACFMTACIAGLLYQGPQ